jgi:dihydrofolate reductase
MLMGRGTYEYFAAAPPTGSPYADAINAIRKYVFSSTLETADWNNSTIIRDDPVAAVNELKHQDGRDLIMYGHGRLSQTLLQHELLDEIRFAVHPLLLTGRPAGHGNGQTPPLKLIGATPLQSGVVVLSYQRDQN